MLDQVVIAERFGHCHEGDLCRVQDSENMSELGY